MKKIILKIKPFQGTLGKGWCGPQSLKIVLNYYGVSKSEKELVKLCRASLKLGSSYKDIVKAAKKLGFKTRIKYNATFPDIAACLRKGIPPIVDWFTRGRRDYSNSDISDGHYSVVTGLDDKFIYLQDPEIGEIRKLNRKDFLKIWFDFKGEYPKKADFIIRGLIVIYR